MLQPDPARRWSAEQVLMHPWVRGPEVGEAEMAAELQKMSRHAVGAPLPISASQGESCHIDSHVTSDMRRINAIRVSENIFHSC